MVGGTLSRFPALKANAVSLIDKLEIDAKAEELGIHAANVQRDYVFGWLLAGLAQVNNRWRSALILKGGNCFRKATIGPTTKNGDFHETDLSRHDYLEPALRPERRSKDFCAGPQFQGPYARAEFSYGLRTRQEFRK